MAAVLLSGGATPAAGKNDVAPVAGATAGTTQLQYSVLGTRLASQIYWRIDSEGKGELGTPGVVSYRPAPLLATDPQYVIAPGVHQFDIGPDGYRELRTFLRLIVDVRRDPEARLTEDLDCRPSLDSGSIRLSWDEQGGGSLMLPNDCLSTFGRTFHQRIGQSWFVLARALHRSGHAALSIAEQTDLPVPRVLRYSERGIWSPNLVEWQVDEQGEGWIEYSAATALQPFDLLEQRHYVGAGRYRFRLDTAFHQALLRELDPVLSGQRVSGACEDEVSLTDQPAISIGWTDQAGQERKFFGDLGCPSLRLPAGRIGVLFAELQRNGRLGDATMANKGGN